MECKLCNREVNALSEFGICDRCGVILDVKIKSLSKNIVDYQEKANSATDPDEKIIYFKRMLEMLYEYKILYYDNDVDVLEQDVEEMIDNVVDAISYARE